MTRKILLGLGNPVGQDDAVGLRVAALLSGSEWEVFATSVPENILGAVNARNPDLLVVVDAAEMGLPPGSIRRLPLSLSRAMLGSTHSLPLPFLLSFLAPQVKELVLVGIQPKEVGPGERVSSEVAEGAKALAELLRRGEISAIPEL